MTEPVPLRQRLVFSLAVATPRGTYEKR